MADASADTNGTDPASSSADRFNVNFFRPRSPHAREDMRLILRLFIIWVVAVFGFQVLLIALNRETPEETYLKYQSVWPQIQADSASVAEQQTFARTILGVLGKNIVLSQEEKDHLQQALAIVVLDLLPADEGVSFTVDLKNSTESLAPTTAVSQAASAIGLVSSGMDEVLMSLLPSSLVEVKDPTYSSALPDIMKKYLVHNQSALTDFKFIGFPFHYWYTAQFLLILFVLLCLTYAVLIGRINKKHGFEEK